MNTYWALSVETSVCVPNIRSWSGSLQSDCTKYFSSTRQILLLWPNKRWWDGRFDLLFGLVVRVPGYRSRGPCSIPGATRFSEKYWVWNGVHSASRVQLNMEEIVAGPVYKSENTAVGISCADHATPSIRNRRYNLADKRRSLGRYISVAD
jgi:hypothetical protein